MRSGVVWSATYHPTAREPDDYLVEFRADRATFRRRDDDDRHAARHRRVHRRRRRSPPADDHQSGHADRARSTSPATSRSCWRRRRTISRIRRSASCFSKPSTSPASAALLCHRRPRDPARAAALGRARPEPRRPAAGAGRMGDRSRAVPRPRPGHRRARPRSTAARCRARPASCSTRSSACASGSGSCPGASVRLSFATGIASDRETAAGARAEVPRPERGLARLRAGVHARAERSAPSGDFERRGAAVRAAGVAGALRRRLAAGAAGRDRVERARPGRAVAARHLRRSADPARARRRRRRRGARAAGAAGAGVLAPERAERRCRHPQRGARRAISTRCTRSSRRCSTTGPWRTWKHRSGGAYLLRGDDSSAARAHADRGRRAGGAQRRPRRPPRPARPAAPGPDASRRAGVRGRLAAAAAGPRAVRRRADRRCRR